MGWGSDFIIDTHTAILLLFGQRGFLHGIRSETKGEIIGDY